MARTPTTARAKRPAPKAAPRHQAKAKPVIAQKPTRVRKPKPAPAPAAPALVTNRFRPVYRPLSMEESNLLEAIKLKATELEQLINQAPQGRHAALGMTALEESVMWAVKAVTA